MYVLVFGFLVSFLNCLVVYILIVMIMKEILNKFVYVGKDKNLNFGYVSVWIYVFEVYWWVIWMYCSELGVFFLC